MGENSSCSQNQPCYYGCIYTYIGENMTLTQAVKRRINEILAQKNVSLYSLSKSGHISPNTLKSIMAEHCKGANLKTVMQIIRAFEMKASEFFNSPLFDSFELDID